MSIKISRITGCQYDTVSQKDTWHNNRRFHSAEKLAKIFNFELCQPDTNYNIEQSIKSLDDMYHRQQMSPQQLVKYFKWTYKQDFASFMKRFGIKRRTLSDSLLCYAKSVGREITDEKKLFWKSCQFKLTKKEMTNIPGFDLFIKHKPYHPVKNPGGVCKDHILSIMDAWTNRYDPDHISHPANCQFLLNKDNIKKGSSSGITYDELLVRIESWNKNIIPVLTEKSISISKSPEHIEKIRRSINKRYQDIRDGIIVVSKYPKCGGRKPGYVDWVAVQRDIDSGLDLESIKNKYDIKYKIYVAKNKGIIRFDYRSERLIDKFDWVEINKHTKNKTMKVKDIKLKFGISAYQYSEAKKQKLL